MILLGRKITTWKVEAATAAIILSAVVVSTGGDMREWIGAGAVFFGFLHAKIADRMAERQAAMPKPSVTCHHRLLHYFVAKEALWLVYFTLSQTWSALAGVILFLLYPVWRRYYRSRNPLKMEEPPRDRRKCESAPPDSPPGNLLC